MRIERLRIPVAEASRFLELLRFLVLPRVLTFPLFCSGLFETIASEAIGVIELAVAHL